LALLLCRCHDHSTGIRHHRLEDCKYIWTIPIIIHATLLINRKHTVHHLRNLQLLLLPHHLFLPRRDEEAISRGIRRHLCSRRKSSKARAKNGTQHFNRRGKTSAWTGCRPILSFLQGYGDFGDWGDEIVIIYSMKLLNLQQKRKGRSDREIAKVGSIAPNKSTVSITKQN
jgi:hypothetical protein